MRALVLAGGSGESAHTDESVPLLRDREAISGKATAYVCRGYVCEAPVTDSRALGEQLERAAGGLGR